MTGRSIRDSEDYKNPSPEDLGSKHDSVKMKKKKKHTRLANTSGKKDSFARGMR